MWHRFSIAGGEKPSFQELKTLSARKFGELLFDGMKLTDTPGSFATQLYALFEREHE